MKKLIYGLILVFLFSEIASAGTLFGRIIQENGRSLAKTKIIIEGEDMVTNEFGGYKVELPDGERELNVMINDIPFTSEKIKIYSPKTKQNWRIEYGQKRLIRIR